MELVNWQIPKDVVLGREMRQYTPEEEEAILCMVWWQNQKHLEDRAYYCTVSANALVRVDYELSLKLTYIANILNLEYAKGRVIHG